MRTKANSDSERAVTMIQLSKNYSLPDRLSEFVPVKVVSVGGAGLSALDRIVLDGLEKAERSCDQYRRTVTHEFGCGA